MSITIENITAQLRSPNATVWRPVSSAHVRLSPFDPVKDQDKAFPAGRPIVTVRLKCEGGEHRSVAVLRLGLQDARELAMSLWKEADAGLIDWVERQHAAITTLLNTLNGDG